MLPLRPQEHLWLAGDTTTYAESLAETCDTCAPELPAIDSIHSNTPSAVLSDLLAQRRGVRQKCVVAETTLTLLGCDAVGNELG